MKNLWLLSCFYSTSIKTTMYSFPMYLLETGTDLRYIQELLGHGSSKTTEIYTHVSKKYLANIKLPLDRLIEEQNTDNKTFTSIKF
ncbi:MAG: hypothetical protein DA394_08170 [Candidatus Arcticimaribacter sp.]|nr:MAG: hypothetical protein DA394_08170 [Candidatus Arcticimaribacter sp.]